MNKILIALACLVLNVSFAHAQVGDMLDLSPHWDWKSIETEHFRLSFPVELEPVAQKSARYFEEAHQLLVPTFRWEPSYKVQVLVIDNSDLANGLTSPALRMGIVLLTTPPEPWFSTSYYDDWLRLLVIHEYTHFLNIDPTRGLWGAFRYALGDILLPNATWPGWMTEGLAVYMETRLTRSGRGRSSLYDMILRSAVEAGVLNSPLFITLDKINGPDPYFPGGETAYLFGYQLMNRVAATTPTGPTFDRADTLTGGDDALGLMSWRSANRVPYFINGNLENITGKDWSQYWSEWTDEARARASKQLGQIRSQPVTQLSALTAGNLDTFGPAVSMDGQWLAYTADSLDRRKGLHLIALGEGQSRHVRVGDKSFGAGMAFMPGMENGSHILLCSAIRRTGLYYTFSDLAVYDLERDQWEWLSKGLRAKDPDVSPDGKWVVFSLSADARTGLARAPLIKDGRGKVTLGEVEKIYWPEALDRASNPKVSADGRRVVFSLHPNGRFQEDLVELEISSRAMRSLVADGAFNRYPAFDGMGTLYFISDRTGVSNLYRLSAGGTPELVSNVTTGLAFPAFGRGTSQGEVFASVLSYTGWDLARFIPAAGPLDRKALTLSPPPAPSPVAGAQQAAATTYPVEDYSVIPSIWPRQWIPYLSWSLSRFYIGGQILGYDAVDRHRYVVAGGLDSLTRTGDISVNYINRTLGPSIGVSVSHFTTEIASAVPVDYTRKSTANVSVSYPIRWTNSSLEPSLGFGVEAVKRYVVDPISKERLNIQSSLSVPVAVAGLAYSDVESSRLAVAPERGRNLSLAIQSHFESDQPTWQFLFRGREHLYLGNHTVLTPSLTFGHSSRVSSYSDANVSVNTRGYPLQPFHARSAVKVGTELNFPLARIYRGAGTYPAFLEDLHGVGFVESTALVALGGNSFSLPAAGIGLRLDSHVFVHVPLTFSLTLQRGFREDKGGAGELILELSGIGF